MPAITLPEPFIMKKTILASIVILATGCSQSGGGGGSTAIQGTDLSGSYRMVGIECYSSSTGAKTAEGTLSNTSPTGTMTVRGNTTTSESIGDGGCRINMTRSFVATLESGTRTSGYGSIALGATTAVIPNGTSCGGTISFDMTTGTLTPASVNASYTPDQSVSAQEVSMIVNSQAIAIASIFQVSGSPTDICLMIYQKL